MKQEAHHTRHSRVGIPGLQLQAGEHVNIRFAPDGVYEALSALDLPCYVVRMGDRVGAGNEAPPGATLLAAVPPMPTTQLGSAPFLTDHAVRYPYMAGSMAGGIASVDLVIAMARAGYLASFGAAGLPTERVEQSVARLGREIPDLPYAANLIHNPLLPHLERDTVEVYLRHRVRCVEASAFVQLTPDVVRYRVAGLRTGPALGVHADNRVIAKVSRVEVAELFLRPAPEEMLADLVAAGSVTAEQADLARRVPLADDITVEADSAGHTDRRPLVTLLPQMLRRSGEISRELGYPAAVRVGAAGGIGTPQAALAAFASGADYVVTGSINQACVEAGTSSAAKELLAAAGPADCVMAPAADMFEMGVQVQVLRKGSLFPGRAARLYQLYREHSSVEEIPPAERERLRTEIFRHDLDHVWAETLNYLRKYHPAQVEPATTDAKRRLGLLFRWYLGMSARWATTGEADRAGDYQIWCGPAMGAFNDWVRATTLEPLPARRVADVAHYLLRGAAFHARLAQLRFAGVRLPSACSQFRLPPLTSGRGAAGPRSERTLLPASASERP